MQVQGYQAIRTDVPNSKTATLSALAHFTPTVHLPELLPLSNNIVI